MERGVLCLALGRQEGMLGSLTCLSRSSVPTNPLVCPIMKLTLNDSAGVLAAMINGLEQCVFQLFAKLKLNQCLCLDRMNFVGT